MKVLILLCTCAVLATAATAERKADKRFIGAVSHWFHHVGDTIVDTAVNAGHAIDHAAHTVGDAIKDTAVNAGHAITDAAHTVGDTLTDAANTVKDGVVDAAHSVASFTNQAKNILAPILNQVAGTVGPIAQSVIESAVNQLIQNAPEILTTLGQMGVEQLATTLIESAAAGKRDVSQLEHLKTVFATFVQQEVNKTVNDVHKAVALAEEFNTALKKEVKKLEFALQTGAEVETAARHFFSNVFTAMQPLIDGKVFDLDLDCFDSVISTSIQRFGDEMRAALHRGVQKRGLLLDLAGGVSGLLHTGEQHISNLISGVHNLAQGILAPTLENVKNIAQTLLNNVGSVTQSLVTKAMSLLAPFQQQLGPLFQQVETLAGNIGLHQ